MKNQIRILTIISIVLCLLVAIIYLFPQLKKLTEWERNFAVEKIEKVHKIEIKDNAKNEVLKLTKRDSIWYVNDSIEARPGTVMDILSLLEGISISYPVSKASMKNVLNEMIAKYKLVTVFDENNEELTSFMVGGHTPNDAGTYMLRVKKGKQAKQPYVVSLPGSNSYISAYFKTDILAWRSRLIFAFKPDQLSQLIVDYPNDQKSSFKILRNTDGQYSISPLITELVPNSAPDKTRLNEYIRYYSGAYAESFINDYPGIDTIKNTIPYCVIKTIDDVGKTKKVTLYRKAISDRSKTTTDVYGQPLLYDQDKLIGLINSDRDLVLIQFFVFGKYLKKYRDFFPAYDISE